MTVLAIALGIGVAQAAGIAALTQPNCDPTMQSCAPGVPVAPGPQACGPAAGGATACGNGPATLGNQSGTNQGAGNPINVITGNKYQREDDLPALPGVLGLEIVRHYNSAYSTPDIASGIFGRGWKLSYETDLYAIGETLQIVQADGTRIIFNRNADNRNLCATADPAHGSLRIERGRDGERYVWTWTDGRELRFDNVGKLVQIAVPTGEFVSLQRDAKGVLLQVTDPQGRQLRLQYPTRDAVGGNRFRGVASISSPVGVFTYQYGSVASQPVQSRQPQPAGTLANLVKVGFPDDTARLYHHEDVLHPTFLTGISSIDARKAVAGADDRNTGVNTGASALNAAVSTASNAIPNAARNAAMPAAVTGLRMQRIATYLYDRNGRAILTVHGEPARLQTSTDGNPVQPARLAEGTGVGQVTLDFSTPGMTVLNNSLGQKTVYRHGIVGDQYRLLEVRGAGCSQCGEVDVRYAYDKLGRLLQTTRLDARGQPLWATTSTVDELGRTLSIGRIDYQDGKAGMEQPRLRYAYGPGPAAAPIQITRPSIVPGREVRMQIGYNDKGQVVGVEESGWMPALPGRKEAQPAAIHRSLTYRYALINGRSVLVDVDGPLAKGAGNRPADSDITHAEWDRLGNAIVSLTARGGFKTTMTHDGAGRIATLTDAEGHSTVLTHDYRSRLLGSTRDGQTQVTQYDAQGNPVETGVVNSTGSTVSYRPSARLGFDQAGRNTWVASHLGILTRNRYDGEGNLLEATTESAHFRQVQQFGYDATGHMVAAIDPAGGIRTITWNQAGRPQAVVDALGRETRFRFDANGNLQQASVAAVPAAASIGPRAAWSSDSRRPDRNDGPKNDRTAGEQTTFEHDVQGNTSAVIAPNGATTRYFLDDFGRTVAVVSPDSGIDLRRHDAAGRIIASSDARGNRATYDYDAAGRIIRQTVFPAGAGGVARPVSTHWQYDGLRLVAVNQGESTERYLHDAAGRLVGRTMQLAPESGAGNSGTADTSSTTGGIRSIGNISNISKGTSASDVSNGNRAAITSTTLYRHDAEGQLQGISLPDGSSIEYRRNGQRQVTAIERNRLQSAWLKWLLPAQTIITGLERDIAGLKAFRFGNGVQARYQRSPEGILARIVYLQPDSSGPRGVALHALAGIGTASAAEPSRPTLPGAFGLPDDRHALLDHRYLWDAAGNLLQSEGRSGVIVRAGRYAYDAQDRLIGSASLEGQPAQGNLATDSASSIAAGAPAGPDFTASYGRYFHDSAGNRLLSQEGIADQHDLVTGTVRTRYQAASNRAQASTDGGTVSFDAAGQPTAIGQRRLVWDALGKLSEVRDGDTLLARYRYDSHGRRVGKRTQQGTTHYLYDDRDLVAELDDAGNILRQYVYLAGQPVAIIDLPAGVRPQAGTPTFWSMLRHDLGVLRRAWFGADESIAYLHNNHLGATELITDDRAQPLWRAAYSPYGAARIVTAAATGKGQADFVFNLRFPGQYADAETGLYYNDHRYYDPQHGRYLTPDPLGLRGGVNSYAYVANNPLKNIDPSGLILFAFDGTGNNSRDDSKKIDSSNVALLYRFYDQSVSGQNFAEYQRGVGTEPTKSWAENKVEKGFAIEGKSLIDSELNKWHGYIASLKPQESIVLDVIGFSRGAAEARDFSNRIRAEVKGNQVNGHCIEFRFLGLFDTVSQFGRDGSNDGAFDFSIAPEWKSVAQAYALNEHRALYPLRSIQGATAPYIEKGFVGSHSDIGGGYLEKSESYPGDLSDVALMWMVQQAEKAGIQFTTIDDEFRQVTRPVVHDERNASFLYGKRYTAPMYDESHDTVIGTYPADERLVKKLDGTTTTQTKFGLTDPVYGSLMEGVIRRPPGWEQRVDNCAGAVDMKSYRAWLEKNYGLVMQKAVGENTNVVCKQ